MALPPLVAILTANIEGFERGMLRAQALTDEGGLAGAMRGLGTVGVALGATLVALGAHAVDLASKFDATMLQLHTEAQVPLPAVATLSNQVLDLAGKVGFSPQSLAEALYHIESAMATTPARLQQVGGAMAVLQAAAEGAQIGGSDLATTTDALDSLLVSGIPGINSATDAMQWLLTTVGAGDMTMSQLTKALSNGLIPEIKLFGATSADASAGLALLGDNLERGQKAGTQLRMVYQDLSVLAQTKMAEAVEATLKLGSNDIEQVLTKQGLVPALEFIVQKLKDAKVPMTDWGQYMTELFGRRAGTGIAMMVTQMDRLESKYPSLTGGAKTFAESWKEAQQQFSVQMAQFKSGLEALEIRLGNYLIPYVEKAVQVLENLVTYFEHNRSAAILLGTAIGGVVVSGLIAAAAAAASFLGPTLLLITAIAAMSAGIVYAYTHWKFFHDIVNEVATLMKNYMWPALQDAWKMIQQDLEPAVQSLSQAYQKNKSWIDPLITTAAKLTAGFLAMNVILSSELVKVLGATLGGSINLAVTGFGIIINVVGSVINTFRNLINVAKEAASAISNVVGAAGSAVGGAVSSLKSLFGGAFAEGGPVPGPIGAPRLILAHGGEFVLSRAMMSGATSGGGVAAPAVSSGATIVQSHIYIDGQQVTSSVQRQVLRYNQRNTGNGLQLMPGR